ncbi:hypothetical protein RBB50_009341 [Rhinocladiella similis]
MAGRGINPIVPGMAPDPSICFVKDTFYLVNSTFQFFPGLPIYASKNLVDWTLIGNAINRKTQLDLTHTGTRYCPQKIGEDLLAAGGLHAPTIRYHSGTFYIVCTNVTHPEGQNPEMSFENFIITTKDIWADHWSDPIYFELYGFDPSLFFDDDGKAYMIGTQEPGPSLNIIQYQVDVNTGKKLSEKKVIFTGVSEYFPEGPHMYKKDGRYYLLIAEGGTHENHSVNIARSHSIWGPFESCEHNPILTARGTDEYIQHVGHADLVQDAQGEWWAVCLGVRKRDNGRYVLGRETFLTKCTWPQDGWPSLGVVRLALPQGTEAPKSQTQLPPARSEAAEFLMIRGFDPDGVHVSKDRIILTPKPGDFSDVVSQIAFAGKRQRSLNGSASLTLRVEAEQAGLKAGLGYYKDEFRHARFYYDFGKSTIGMEVVNTMTSTRRQIVQPVERTASIDLRLQYTEMLYTFSFRVHGALGWTTLGSFDTADVTAYDFIGPVIGPFAQGTGVHTPVEFINYEVA